ncbi:MAG: ATP-binding protein [Prevotella sp.]|nr:ATP-binding protein [Prevotella sp.]
MFERTILTQLREWKQDHFRKPLILRGARQVGKTTVVNEFGKDFDNYLYFNLERDNDLKLLEMPVPLNDLVDMMFARNGKKIRRGSTLIFIDEIQNSPKTIALLRFFYEERSDLHIVAAGSLLENIVDIKASFPVGRVQYMALRPCSFMEFISAVGRNNLLEVLNNPNYTMAFHEELMALFNQYTIVGGMPEVVQRYAITHDMYVLDNVYETLIQAYKDDVEKYVRGNKLTEVVRYILNTGWAKAGEAVTLGGFGESQYGAREVGEAFRLLSKAMLLELVYPTTSSRVPALAELKRKPKLIWMDCGLVNYQAQARKELIGADDILDVWRGRIAEQIVAQELLTLNSRVGETRSFWIKERNKAEVDFIFIHDSTVFPIEVKSGHNSRLRSLHSFIDEAPVDIGIRVWSGNYSVEEHKTTIKGKPFKLINLPFYLIGRLPAILNSI